MTTVYILELPAPSCTSPRHNQCWIWYCYSTDIKYDIDLITISIMAAKHCTVNYNSLSRVLLNVYAEALVIQGQH